MMLPGLNLSFNVVSLSYIAQITSDVTIQGINKSAFTDAGRGQAQLGARTVEPPFTIQ